MGFSQPHGAHCRAVSCVSIIHGLLLVALVALGWNPWYLLLLVWPVLGFCGSRASNVDLLRTYCVGCVLMAAGHLASALVHVPRRVCPVPAGVCSGYELCALFVSLALVRRIGETRKQRGLNVSVQPSSNSSIVPV